MATINIGKTTFGVLGNHDIGQDQWACIFPVTAEGTIQSVVVALEPENNGDDVEIAIFEATATTIGNMLAHASASQDTVSAPTQTWYTFNSFTDDVAGGRHFLPGTYVALVVKSAANPSGYILINYDAGTTEQSWNGGNASYPAFTTPFVASFKADEEFGIYAVLQLTELDQEGFRFRNDDGNETTATWKAAQDTNATSALSANVRLRFCINATDDPASSAYQLYYKKSSETHYKKVQVGATVTTPTFVAKGAFTSGAAALAVPAPAGIQANDFLLLKVESANEAITSPGGDWVELPTDSPQFTGTAATAGGVRLALFYKFTTGTETDVTIADSGNHTTAIMSAYRGVDRNSPIHVSAGSVDAAATTSVSCPAVTTTINNCLIVNIIGLDKDLADSDTLASVANASLGSVTEQHDQTVSTGVGGGIAFITGTLDTAGNSGNTTATGDTSTTHAYITVALAPERRNIYISPTANITASGDNTTAQLTAPATKTTSDFTTGRMWDDENGTDSIDIANNFYTELEWCLQAQSPAANADVYQFRVYRNDVALNSYSVTPQWTIGTPGGNTSNFFFNS